MAEAPNYMHSDKSGENITQATDGGTMTREERCATVLSFMKEHPIPMPPIVIYRALKFHRGIAFSDDTVKRCLNDLTENGDVLRVQKKPLNSGDLVEAGQDARAYYVISEQGVESLQSD